MKRLPLLLVVLSIVLLSSALPYARPAPVVNLRDPLLSGIQAAALKTGAPEPTLDGLAFVESSGRPDPQHIDPADKGRFGLHETPAYHAERAKKYGAYDALDPYDSAYIAGRLYTDALAALGSEDAAICAHKQGIEGVWRDGLLGWYLARVKKGATK